jgi:pimeloyl-ACP methyl ester carboxylesterase
VDRNKHAYFISGLGADRRAFKKIVLPPEFEVRYIDWIIPKRNEPFRDYCLRLAEPIDKTRDFVLIGLSFGGIVVTELTHVLKPAKSIIISSISSRRQMPGYFRIIGMLRIHRLVPVSLLKNAYGIAYWLFGTKTEDERKTLRRILKETNEVYLEWSINAILNWRCKEKPNGIFHIHGTKDKILPIRFVQPDETIKGGRHFMVLSRAEEVSEAIRKELNR